MILVGKTEINWNVLLVGGKKLLGRSLSSQLDARSLPIGDTPAYLAVLAELEEEGTSPSDALREAGALLRQVSYTFLGATDLGTFVALIATTGLCPVGTHECFLICGNLEQWRNAVIAGLTSRSTREIRAIMTRLLAAFEQEGLGPLWSDYDKSALPDRTVLLLERR